ncbi:unnamed protein product [Cladocopium goreaui]|nr:unnamed protein product [Cladocopium goreaui]
MQDPHWTNEARNAMRTRIFPMRMERIDKDFLHLQDVLCRSFSYCRPLPSLPKVVPHGSTGRGYMPQTPPPVQELWTSEAQEIVRTMFQSDFTELGYSQDLQTEKPLEWPRVWQKFTHSSWMTQWQTSSAGQIGRMKWSQYANGTLHLLFADTQAVHLSCFSPIPGWRMAPGIAIGEITPKDLFLVKSFGAELLACAKGSMWTLSLSKLDEMKNLHIQPNMVVWSEIVASVAAERHWRIALDLLRRAEAVGAHPEVVYNSVMTAFGGDWQKAVLVLEASASKRLQPSVVSLNSILSACAVAANWAKAAGHRGAGKPRHRCCQSKRPMAKVLIFAVPSVPAELFGGLPKEDSSLITEGRVLRLSSCCALEIFGVFSACIAGLDWCNGLHLLAIADTSTTSTGRRLLSAVNAAAAVCGGLRSSSGVTSPRKIQNSQNTPKWTQWTQKHEKSQESNWHWSLELLQSAVKAEVKLDIVAFNAMVGGSGASSGWQQAVNHFSALQRHGMLPDRITFSTFHVIPWQGALQLTHDMIRQSLRGDSQLSMLKSAAASAEAATNPGSDLWTKALYLCSFDLGKAEADKVDKGDKVSLSLHRSVLGACAAAASWSQAVIAFVETAPAAARKDNLSFLAAIKACARGQQHSFTQQMLKTMENLKVEKTKEIYTAAMGSANDAFGQGLEGGWEWSLTLLREMRSTEVEVDAVALGVVLSVCLRARCWEVALQLADLAMDSGSLLASTGAAAVIAGAGQIVAKIAGMFRRAAVQASDHRRDRQPGDQRFLLRVEPGVAGYAASLDGCCHGRGWRLALSLGLRMDRDRALRVFSSSSDWRLKGDLTSLNSTMTACRNAARTILNDLCAQRLAELDGVLSEASLDVISFNITAGAYASSHSWQNAVACLKEMCKATLRPTSATFNTLMTACEKSQHWQRALFLYKDMLQFHLEAAVEGYGGGSPGGSPGSRRSSVLDESSDEEDRIIYSFPGETTSKPLPFASQFGSPYRDPATDSRSPQDKESKSESSSGIAGTGPFGFANKLFDLLGFQSEAKPAKPAREDVLPMDDALRASLDKISDTVRELLTLAKSCGQVAIVTLSRRPWVANSASEYLPKLGIEALLKELRIPVIYSRECVKPYMMRSPDGAFEEGVCPLTMAKELAMKVLKKLYGKNPWKNVLSIGDSVTERTAITELLWAHMGEDSRSCCKTLKMLQDPTIEQLQMELNIIKDALPEMAKRGEDFSLCIDETGQKVAAAETGLRSL